VYRKVLDPGIDRG